MKIIYLLFILVVIGNIGYAQNVMTAFKTLRTINSVEEFAALVAQHPDWRITLDTITQGTSSLDDVLSRERLLIAKKGDTLINDLAGYGLFQAQKILKCYALPIYTCKYIAIDFNSLNCGNADSLKSSIIEKLGNGADFEELAKVHSMDGNKDHGKNFIFHNSIFKEFTEAVKSHEVGDVFSVDIPNINWSFVIYKSKPDSVAKAVTFVSIDL
jgi:hypothetical protein